MIRSAGVETTPGGIMKRRENVMAASALVWLALMFVVLVCVVIGASWIILKFGTPPVLTRVVVFISICVVIGLAGELGGSRFGDPKPRGIVPNNRRVGNWIMASLALGLVALLALCSGPNDGSWPAL